MCSKEVLDQILTEVSKQAQSSFGDSFEKIILYGSNARGDANDESDINIMVLVKWPKEDLKTQRKNWCHIESDLGLEHGVFVSIRLESSVFFEAWRKVIPLLRNISEEGIAISI